MSEFRYDRLNDRQVKALADSHTGLYESRLRHANDGTQGVRVEECQRLLAIWRRIAIKVQQGNWRLRLETSEINEIKDALASGDYDDMLRACGDRPS